jgi:rRNA maturation protein Nop10
MNCEEVEDGIYTYHCDDCGRDYKSMHDGKFQGIGLCKKL